MKFLFLFYLTFLYFGGVFSKTIIPLTLVEYEMVIANLHPWLALGIIVKCTGLPFLVQNS